jgi:hypothetical protein
MLPEFFSLFREVFSAATEDKDGIDHEEVMRIFNYTASMAAMKFIEQEEAESGNPES